LMVFDLESLDREHQRVDVAELEPERPRDELEQARCSLLQRFVSF
jgi:hypothetical protein